MRCPLIDLTVSLLNMNFSINMFPKRIKLQYAFASIIGGIHHFTPDIIGNRKSYDNLDALLID